MFQGTDEGGGGEASEGAGDTWAVQVDSTGEEEEERQDEDEGEGAASEGRRRMSSTSAGARSAQRSGALQRRRGSSAAFRTTEETNGEELNVEEEEEEGDLEEVDLEEEAGERAEDDEERGGGDGGEGRKEEEEGEGEDAGAHDDDHDGEEGGGGGSKRGQEGDGDGDGEPKSGFGSVFTAFKRSRKRKSSATVIPLDHDDDDGGNGSDGGAGGAGGEKGERGHWTGRLDFLLSCLGYAVGLGNVWRFPYLCYKHGGGAFLVPYALMLFLIGIPCFFLEISLGQYSAMGPSALYANMAPMFKGLGFSNLFASSMVALYYNMIIAWTIYYTFASFTSHLPWEDCGQSHNTDFCFSINDYKNCTSYRKQTGEEVVYHLGRCLTDPSDLSLLRDDPGKHYGGCTWQVPARCGDTCSVEIEAREQSGIYVDGTTCESWERARVEIQDGDVELFDIPAGIRKTAAEEYFTREVLDESGGLEELGGVQWRLLLCLLAAWAVVCLCLIRGIKSSGKVVYFTATFPYLILVVLFVRAVTLPGASKGIKFYMQPDWSRLSDVKVWEGAAVQIFFSLSVAGGGLMTLASYNPFHNNVLRDTLIVCFGNCLTSVFAGFAIFSVLGFLATEMDLEVTEVVKGGPGLAFVAYPDLVTRLPISPLWAILFFFMLFTLGLDSQFAIVETVVTGLQDAFPRQLRPSGAGGKRPWMRKTLLVVSVCTGGFVVGIPFTCKGGSYLIDLLDYYAAGWPYLFIALMELLILGYVYGVETFFRDLRAIFGFRPGHWTNVHLQFLYLTLAPLIVAVILFYSWWRYEPLTRGSAYVYPPWSNALGWAVAAVAILPVFVVAGGLVFHRLLFVHRRERLSRRFSLTFSELLSPTEEWRANEAASRKEEEEEKGEASSASSLVEEDEEREEEDAGSRGEEQ